MSKVAVAKLSSASAYSQSKRVRDARQKNESYDDMELRVWKERCHWTPDGHLMIPPTAFKNCLSEAAKYLSMQVPGKGKATYTKNFEAGVIVTEGLVLPKVTRDTIQHEVLYVPADGRRGGSKRVDKCFPVIPSWSGTVKYHIMDDLITEEVFHKHLVVSGSLIGIGRFRPRNNGFYGRFSVDSMEWKEFEV